ncbi:MAG: NosD domain-containing protein [Candidatus Bathyarchaeota archaeon]
MRKRANRMSSATVLVLILAIASTVMIVSPTVMALTINTTASAGANPNPVSVGTQVQLRMNIDPDPPSGYYQNVLITVTEPDATVLTLGPFSTDSLGQTIYYFTPTLVGTYSLNFSYPGETLNGDTYTPCEIGPILFDSVPDPFRVHNLDTGINYTSIQSAINAPETLNDHTILVDSGTYHENVEITKSITLTGEDSNNTIIDGGGVSSVVYVEGVNGVAISGFTIKNGEDGIDLNGSDDVIVSGNSVTNNSFGISITDSSGDVIYHNSFIDNTVQTSVTSSSCTWDDGYPSGGNYWSDYIGTDADGDGIGDTPYVIDEGNQDNYPLTKPLGTIESMFNVTTENATLYVGISSNSSISEFEFSQSSKQVSFNVTGLTGTTGFCNITIPEDLLWGDFSLYLNGEPLIDGVDYTGTSNDTHNSFYIAYSHSSHKIEITGTHVIPEYYSLVVLSLLLTATSLIVTKRKRLFHQGQEGM